MDGADPVPDRVGRAGYGETVLVAAGWQVAAFAGLYVRYAATPEPPPDPDGCTALYSCASDLDMLALLGPPAGLGLLLLTLLVAAPARLLTRSVVVAGTVTAAGTVAAAWALLAAVAAGR